MSEKLTKDQIAKKYGYTSFAQCVRMQNYTNIDKIEAEFKNQQQITSQKAFTIEEVLELLYQERSRAVKICNENRIKYEKSHESRLEAEEEVHGRVRPTSIAWVDRERAEVARNCGNSIANRTGLDSPDLTLKDIINRDYKHLI